MLVAALEDGDEHFFGSTGIGRALENDQLSGAQMGRNGLGCVSDVAEIRLVILTERSGDADDDRVHAGDLRVIRSGGETMRPRRLDLRRGDAIDVRPAGLKNIYLLLVNVETGHGKRLLAEEQRQRQADIAHSDNAHLGSTRLDFDFQGFVLTDTKTLRHEELYL